MRGGRDPGATRRTRPGGDSDDMGLPATTPLQIEDNMICERSAWIPRACSGSLADAAGIAPGRLRPTQRKARPTDIPRFLSGHQGQRVLRAQTDLSEVWELRLSLDWSIFDGGNRIARYREAKANFDAAQARVRATELDVSREVEQAQNNVTEAQERIQAAQVAVASAQENFRLAQGRFDAASA